LEPAQVGTVSLWFVFVEQLDGAPEVSVAHGLMREVHVRNILVDARGGFLGFGLAPQTRFLDLQRQRLMFGAGGADRLPKTQACGGEAGGWAGRLVFANGAATLLDRRAH